MLLIVIIYLLYLLLFLERHLEESRVQHSLLQTLHFLKFLNMRGLCKNIQIPLIVEISCMFKVHLHLFVARAGLN